MYLYLKQKQFFFKVLPKLWVCSKNNTIIIKKSSANNISSGRVDLKEYLTRLHMHKPAYRSKKVFGSVSILKTNPLGPIGLDMN